MAAEKFLTLDTASLYQKQVSGTQVSTGVGSGGKLVALDDSGLLDISLFPSGIASASAQPVITTEVGPSAIPANTLVGINGSGQLVEADSSTGIPAIGVVTEAYNASDANGKVYNDTSIDISSAGSILGTGVSAAGAVYLSTTGQFTQAPSTATGHYLQRVGYATAGKGTAGAKLLIEITADNVIIC